MAGNPLGFCHVIGGGPPFTSVNQRIKKSAKLYKVQQMYEMLPFLPCNLLNGLQVALSAKSFSWLQIIATKVEVPENVGIF